MKRVAAALAIVLGLAWTPSAVAADRPVDDVPVEQTRNDRFCWDLKVFGITVVPYNCFEWPI